MDVYAWSLQDHLQIVTIPDNLTDEQVVEAVLHEQVDGQPIESSWSANEERGDYHQTVSIWKEDDETGERIEIWAQNPIFPLSGEEPLFSKLLVVLDQLSAIAGKATSTRACVPILEAMDQLRIALDVIRRDA